MAKNINVNLTFTANTDQVKNQLANVKSELSSLVNNFTLGKKFSSEIDQGVIAARNLRDMLNSATNVDTGKLDLSRFSASLRQSGKSLQEYQSELRALGPEGQKAFLNLAQSVANAEVPLRNTNVLLNKMMNTLGNTIRWQLSANAINMFTSAISGAYRYAQDLNESLNNIRIVTGYSSDEMAIFAKEANKAAKSLSTSTLNYTDAALIYYQQGLNNQEVKERTDVTIKMANVARESAETVSEWMTAIWNNFDDGSTSLERYADVLTALGAATASSSDEIAGGLEKFAAVADTVGLSFDYASTALATITAQTRQSEDVVGTALKTILARIQDLDLGKTLDDGTTLGQYSQALDEIGVKVLDSTGELREMDDVLDDMGNRWTSLSKAQQVAVAQQIGGIRQYNQVIALMDNWDFFKENLAVTQSAEGTLNKQQEIFSESWEAANQRVKASAEKMYNALIDDKFFIALTDGFSYFLDLVNQLIDAMGGLKGVLPGLISLMLKLFGDKMLLSIRNMRQNMQLTSKSAQQAALVAKQQGMTSARQAAREQAAMNGGQNTLEYNTLDSILGLKEKIFNINRELTDQEQKQLTKQVERLEALREELIMIEKITAEGQEQVRGGFRGTGRTGVRAQRMLEDQTRKLVSDSKSFNDTYQGQLAFSDGAVGLTKFLDNNREAILQNNPYMERIYSSKKNKQGAYDGRRLSQFFNSSINDQGQQQFSANFSNQFTDRFFGQSNITNFFKENLTDRAYKQIIGQLNFTEIQNGLEKEIPAMIQTDVIKGQFDTGIEDGEKFVENVNKVKLGDQIMTAAQGFSSLAMGVSSATSAIETIVGLINGDVEPSFESLSGVLMSVSMAIMGVHSAIVTLQMLGGPLVWTIMAIVAAIAALVAVGVSIYNSFHKQEQAAQKAAEAAQKAAENYQEAAKAYNDLKSSLEDYGKAQQAIDELHKGTREWKDAIVEANEQVLQLLETYPELAQYVENIEGRLTLSDEGQNVALDLANQKMVVASNVKAAMALQSDIADLNADKEKFANENNSYWDKTGEEVAVHAANLIGPAIIGFMLGGPVGAAIGAVGGLALNLADGFQRENARSEDMQKAIEELTEEYKEQGKNGDAWLAENYESAIDDIQTVDLSDDSKQALKDGFEEVSAQIKEGARLDQKSKDLYIQQANNILLNASNFNTENYGSNIQEIAGEMIKNGDLLPDDSPYKMTLEELKNNKGIKYEDVMNSGVKAPVNVPFYENELGLNWVEDHVLWSSATDNLKEAFKKYADFQGYEIKDSDWDAKDDRIKFSYRQNGEEKKDQEITYEELYESLRQIELFNMNSDNLVEKIQALTLPLDNYATGFSALDQSMAAFLKSNDINQIDPEVWEEYGGDAEKVAEAIRNSADNINLNLEDYNIKADELADRIRKEYDEVTAANNKLIRETQQMNATFTEGAKALDVSDTVLRVYTNDLIDQNEQLDKNKKAAAKLAVQHFTMAKALKELKDVFAENIDNLDKATVNSFTYAESLAAVKDSFEKVFGVKVSTKFMEENLSLVKQLAEGSTEALKELRKKVVNEAIDNSLLDDDLKEKFKSALSELSQIAESKPIGTKIDFDDSDVINGLNDALAKGLITVSEIESMFSNANIALPECHMVQVPSVAKSESVSVTEGGVDNDKKTVTKSTTYTTTYTQVPYFGDNPPQYEAETKTIGGQEVTTGWKLKENTGKAKNKLTVSTAGNGQYDKDLVNYGTDEKERKKRLKSLQSEIDRYHEINEVIEDTNNLLDLYKKASDRAFGTNKLILYRKQVELINQNLENHKKKLAEAEGWYRVDRSSLLSQYGVVLDDQGRITNLQALQQQWIQKLAKVAGTSSSDTVQEQFDNFKNAVSKYEESLNMIESLKQSIIEDEWEKADAYLGDLEIRVDLDTSLADDKLEALKYQLDRLENRDFTEAQQIASLTLQMNPLLSQINTAESAVNEIIAKIQSRGGEATQEEIEKLRELRSTIISTSESLEELQQTVVEKIGQAFDSWIDKMDTAIEKFEKLQNLTKNYKNIIDLVGAKNLGITDEIINSLYATQQQVANDKTASSRVRRDAIKAGLEELEKARAEMPDDNEVGKQELDKKIEEQKALLMEANNEVASNLYDALQVAADAFSARVNQISTAFETAVSGIANSLEGLSELWDRAEKTDNRYLDEFERTYEISKLNRQINESISKSSTLGNTKKLKDLQQELLAMNTEDSKVSELQMGFMQKRYELLVAEANLKEAQNAKSVVRLRRDSEGNYGYVYTADQDEVSSYQQKYEDASYNLQKYQKEQLKSTEKSLIELDQKFEQALQKIANDSTLSWEEKQQKIAELTQWYNEQVQYLIGQANWLTEQGAKINSQYNTKMYQDFNDTIMKHIYPDLKKWEELEKQTMKAIGVASEELNKAIKKHSDTEGEAFDAAGLKLEDFKTKAVDYFKAIQDSSSQVRGEIQQINKDMATEFPKAISALTDFADKWNAQMAGRILADTTNVVNKINEVITAASKMSSAIDTALAKQAQLTGASGVGNTTSGVGNTTSGSSPSPAPSTPNNPSGYSITETKNNVRFGSVTKTLYKIDGDWYLKDSLEKVGTINGNTYTPSNGVSLKTLRENGITPTLQSGQIILYSNINPQAKGADSNSSTFSWLPTQNDNRVYKFFNGDYYVRSNAKINNNLPNEDNSYFWYKGSELGKNENGKRYIQQGQRRYVLSKFDTGGYTGAWGKEGRLAMLHQKELVLNADDTKNFLSAVSILRDINSQINLNVAAMRYSGNLSSSHLVPSSTPTEIKQEVTISAEFPNATNHSEIEEAFRNLNNMAIQYIHKS